MDTSEPQMGTGQPHIGLTALQRDPRDAQRGTRKPHRGPRVPCDFLGGIFGSIPQAI